MLRKTSAMDQQTQLFVGYIERERADKEPYNNCFSKNKNKTEE